MTLKDFYSELRRWRLTRYKVINFAIGISGLLVYEFVGLTIYRPYIYRNNIYDFHIADTLGNTFGTLPTLFFLVALLSNETSKGNYLIKLGTLSVILFEIVHPLLGKTIDFLDIIATLITGFISYVIYNAIFNGQNSIIKPGSAQK